MQVKEHQRLHELEFSEAQWEELWAMSFEPFDFESGDALTRGQWTALAAMCLGKAERIDRGDYGGEDGDGVCLDEWADELRTIAGTILAAFPSA